MKGRTKGARWKETSLTFTEPKVKNDPARLRPRGRGAEEEEEEAPMRQSRTTAPSQLDHLGLLLVQVKRFLVSSF